jgi:hypothetical protein
MSIVSPLNALRMTRPCARFSTVGRFLESRALSLVFQSSYRKAEIAPYVVARVSIIPTTMDARSRSSIRERQPLINTSRPRRFRRSSWGYQAIATGVFSTDQVWAISPCGRSHRYGAVEEHAIQGPVYFAVPGGVLQSLQPCRICKSRWRLQLAKLRTDYERGCGTYRPDGVKAQLLVVPAERTSAGHAQSRGCRR